MEKKNILYKNKICNLSLQDTYTLFKNFLYHKCKNWTYLYDIDDLMQISFLGLYKAFNSYDLSKNIEFHKFASVVIENELRMNHRKESKHSLNIALNALPKDDYYIFENLFIDNTSYENIALNNIYTEKLNKELSNLTPLDKKLIIDICFKNKTRKVLAKELNVVPHTIARKHKIALAKIQAAMGTDLQ